MADTLAHVVRTLTPEQRGSRVSLALDIQVWILSSEQGYELRITATENGEGARSAALFTGGPHTRELEDLLKRRRFEESMTGPLIAECWPTVLSAVARAGDHRPDAPPSPPPSAACHSTLK